MDDHVNETHWESQQDIKVTHIDISIIEYQHQQPKHACPESPGKDSNVAPPSSRGKESMFAQSPIKQQDEANTGQDELDIGIQEFILSKEDVIPSDNTLENLDKRES